MRLANFEEAANTRVKLAALELHYQEACGRTMDNEVLQQLALQSLRQTINQLREELIRFECNVKAGRVESGLSV